MARHTRERGARNKISFSMRSLLLAMGNLLVAYIGRAIMKGNHEVALFRAAEQATIKLRLPSLIN